MAILVLIGLMTYTHYGETLDIMFDMMYGQHMMHFLKTGERTFEIETKLQLTKYYGPIGGTLAALIIEPFMPMDYSRSVEVRHIHNFLFSLLGFVAAFHLVKIALGKRLSHVTSLSQGRITGRFIGPFCTIPDPYTFL